MKKTLAFAAVMAASALTSDAAYLVSGTLGTTSQPTAAEAASYGTRFSVGATDVVLNGFAIYDYSGAGDGWTAANAKTVTLYSLSGTTYSQVVTKTFNTAPGASLSDVVTGANMHRGAFNSLTTLSANTTYFLALSELRDPNELNYDGYFTLLSPTPNPAVTGLGITGIAYATVDGEAPPANFDTGDVAFGTGSSFRRIGVIPSIVAVPEAGSSVMALALGAMVLRFRSRRA